PLRGRKLAVKVRRPSVEAEFGGDIRLMAAALGLIRRLGLRRLAWVVEPISEFIAWTREELDFRCEAGYMDRLRRNARDNRAERVPEVVWEYTTRRTLVMEFFDGVTVLNYLRAAAVGPESDVEGFKAGLRRLADEWYEVRGRQRRLRKNFTLVMLDMLRLSRASGVWPERDVIKYIRSAIASDGLITRFAPQFDIGQYLERVCHRHLTWQSWGAVFSYEAVLGWVTAGPALMHGG